MIVRFVDQPIWKIIKSLNNLNQLNTGQNREKLEAEI